MNVEEPTLVEAIKTHAVLHDRPYWYDEARLEFQASVWRRLIESDERDGVVVDDDLLLAEKLLLRPPKPEEEWRHTLALRDISPRHVIDAACERAAARRERAAAAVRNPMSVLYTERIAWHNARDRERLDDYHAQMGEADAAVRTQLIDESIERANGVFVRAVESLIYDLLNSGLPELQTTPVIADLRVRLAGSGLTTLG